MGRSSKSGASDARHLLAVGIPVTIVLGVVILGAVLQSRSSAAGVGGDSSVDQRPLPAPAAYERRLREAAAPDAPVEPVTQPAAALSTPPGSGSVSRLAQRAMDDAVRLETAGGEAWTAQIGVYCDTERVLPLVEQYGDLSSFFVLPTLLDGRACFRVSWGRFADQETARQAPRLPAALRSAGTFPRQVSTVLP